MTTLLPALVPAVGAILVLLTAPRRAAAIVLGAAALLGTLLATTAVVPGQALELGGTSLVPTTYGRLAFALLAAGGSLLGIGAVAAGSGPGGLAAMLATLATAWIALVAPEPVVGSWAVLVGSAAALACASLVPPATTTTGILARAARATVVAGALGVVGMALAVPAAGGPDPDSVVGGLAFVAVAGALVLRTAAVPLHGWAVRLADVVPYPTLAATLAWLPAVAMVVVLAWADATMAPIATELGVERGVLVAVALATLALASLAAWLVEDVGHVVAYLAIASLGLALLGISALDPAAWTPTRSWLVMVAVSATALAAWAATLEGAYGSRWLPDLRGWARRSPLLAVAFVGTGFALVGLPGTAALDARVALVDGAIEGPLAFLARLLLVAPLAPLLRILVVGVATVGSTVHDGRSERPERPAAWAVTVPGPLLARGRAALHDAAALWRLDRIPAASVVALALALLAAAVAAGGFDLAEAAAGPAPGLEAPVEPSLEGPTGEEPLPSEAPGSGEELPGEGASPSP